MFVADVKCSQATWQTVPNSRTGSAKASISEAVVRMGHRTHVIRGRPKGSSVAFGDEMDIISQVRGAFKKFCNSIWCTNDTSKIFMLLFNI